jgi:putative FmdB family regulatory protein
MPFYEYQCRHCGHHMEALQKLSDAPLKKCPSCGRAQLARIVSRVAFRLKGGGWYETDFKSDGENKRNLLAEEAAPEAAASADSAKPEAAKAEPAKADAAESKTKTTTKAAPAKARAATRKPAAAKTRAKPASRARKPAARAKRR